MKEGNRLENTSTTNSESKPSTQELVSRLEGFALASVLAALMLTLLLEALDQTVVGTALPRIVSYLNGFDRYTWVVTAYLLASTTMVPIIGKLSDSFGRKGFLIAGVSIFLVGSILSGLSETMNQLIAFRALQGFGAGMGIALVFTVVGDIFPPAIRARWQGIFGVVYGVANLIGPTLGGYLTDHGPLLGTLVTNATRWRWVFYINIPIGILTLLALTIYLPTNISIRTSTSKGWAAMRRIDFLGAILVATATVCLLLGLTWGSNATFAWGSLEVVGILVASVVLYTAFFINERFAREPVLPLDLFNNQVFSMSMLLSFLQLVVLVGLVIYLPLFLQGVLGVSPTNSGEAITPLTISSVIASVAASLLVARLLRYQWITIVSALLLIAGAYLMTRISTSIEISVMIGFMVVAGLGLGPFFSILQLSAQNAIPRTRLGVGTSAVRFAAQVGAVVGIAIVGTIVNQTLSTDIVSRLPAPVVQQLTPSELQAATDPQLLINSTYRQQVLQAAEQAAVAKAIAQVPPGPQHDQQVATVTAQVTQQVQQLFNQVVADLKTSLTIAIRQAFFAILGFAALMLLATFFLKDIPMKKEWEPVAAPADPPKPGAQEHPSSRD
jgi:EmrB/QacA subfamily drug resistance transporter